MERRKKNKGNINSNSSNRNNNSSNRTADTVSKNVLDKTSEVSSENTSSKNIASSAALIAGESSCSDRFSWDNCSVNTSPSVNLPRTASKTVRSEQTVSNSATNCDNGSQSFSLENLKLPPGITITKVDGPVIAIQRKAGQKIGENVPNSVAGHSPPATSTIVAAPLSGNGAVGHNRFGTYGQGVTGSNVIVVDTGRMKEDMEVSTTIVGSTSSKENVGVITEGKKKNKKKNKNGNQDGSLNVISSFPNPSNSDHRDKLVQTCNSTSSQQLTTRNQTQVTTNSQKLLRMQQQQQSACVQADVPSSSRTSQSAIIKVSGSTVTIRSPALQQAIAAGNRFPQPMPQTNPQEYLPDNSAVEVTSKNGIVKHVSGKKASGPVVNGQIGGILRGKENMPASCRSPNCDSIPQHRITIRNDSNNRHIVQQNGLQESGGGVGTSASSFKSRPQQQQQLQHQHRQQQQQQQQQPPQMKSSVLSGLTDQSGKLVPQMSLANGQQEHFLQQISPVISGFQDSPASSIPNDPKRKKKKKKGTLGQGQADDWNLVESVFTPKDIDLENGDIDDDERELEAFKRFCFNSVPPKRKEKVHLNIKDIVLKKKSSAIGCS